MELELSGRVAVVTGASKGIGLAIVQTLVAEGARVVAASRTRTPALFELGDDVLHVEADLMHPDAPTEIIARAVESFGGVDILVNNAGGPPPGDTLPHGGFLQRSDDDWRGILDFNLMTAVRACRAALPLLIEREGGAIVNVSSAHGKQPAPMTVDYSASKAAMTNLTKALAMEFGPQGVRVNVVSPGATRTPWWTEEGGAADVIATQAGADREGVMATLVPEMMQLTTGRLVEAQEIADAVAWLASPRAGSMSGAEIVVDGGFLKTI
jgi:NAD(P)-dependent dehydrogenase (short-subunit alcohol dehydrogenase family)